MVSNSTLAKMSAGIKKAKESKEHRKKMSEITKELWKDPVYREKQMNGRRPPANKLKDSEKIKKVCPQCTKEFLVVPSRDSRKYCSRVCTDNFKRGKIHKNWNENSLKGGGYRSCYSGWYKEEKYSFRSSYELSVLVMLLGKHRVEVEPFFIWYEYEGERRRYFPDMLIDGSVVVEIKPKRKLEEPMNKAKFQAMDEYCKKKNITFEIMTEEHIDMLSKKDIATMVEDGIVTLTDGEEW